MPTFLVMRTRFGRYDLSRPLQEQSDWVAHATLMDKLVDDGVIILGGPFADEVRVALVFEAESEQHVLAILASDPWTDSHLRTESIERWTIRLDGRSVPNP